MNDNDKEKRLRASALPLSLLASAMKYSGAKNGELDLYRSGKELQRDLADAGALIEVKKPKRG